MKHTVCSNSVADDGALCADGAAAGAAGSFWFLSAALLPLLAFLPALLLPLRAVGSSAVEAGFFLHWNMVTT